MAWSARKLGTAVRRARFVTMIADIHDERDQQAGGKTQTQILQPRQSRAAAPDALIVACGQAPIAHMLSGALAPRSESPLRMTCWHRGRAPGGHCGSRRPRR